MRSATISAVSEHCCSLSIMAAGQFFCSGVCQRVSCTSAARVNQFYPPTLNYSTATTSLLGSKTTIFVQYGSQLPLNLLPCSSRGMLLLLACMPSLVPVRHQCYLALGIRNKSHQAATLVTMLLIMMTVIWVQRRVGTVTLPCVMEGNSTEKAFNV